MPRRTLTKLQIQYLEALVTKEISLIDHVPSTVTEQITLPTLKDLAGRLKGRTAIQEGRENLNGNNP